MAEYKRIVSYLYKYEKGIKGTNVGYVKLEIRQNNLKILIHIQDERAINDKDFQVYFYYRDGSLLKGILSGSLQFFQGESTFRTETIEQSLFDSNYSLDKISGVIVHYNEDFAYGTEWDDKPIVMRKFIIDQPSVPVTPLQDQLVSTLPEQAPEKIEPTFFDNPTSQEKDKIPIQNEPKSADILPRFEETITIKNTILPTEHISSQKTEIVFDKHTLSLPNEEQQQIPHPQTELKLDENFSSFSLNTEQQVLSPPISPINEIAKSDSPAEPSNWKEVHNLPIDRDVFLGLQDIYNPSETEKKEDPFDLLFTQSPPIQHLNTRIPLQLVRIQPQDIGTLPINYWHFGSNSFLIHGFYQFQYLIFGKKLNSTQKDQYLIGVPSLYTEQESEMASQFGFKHFIPMKPTHVQNGTFGYWIALL